MNVTEVKKRQLRQSLVEAIEKWAEETCDDGGFYWGGKTTALMADAAFSVVESVIDVQEYLIDEGYFEEKAA